MPCGKFGSPCLATAAARAALSVLSRVCSMFVCPVVWLPVSGICNVHANVHACDFALGLCGHRKRICTERCLVSGRKIPCRIRDSNPRQHGAWRFGPTRAVQTEPHSVCWARHRLERGCVKCSAAPVSILTAQKTNPDLSRAALYFKKQQRSSRESQSPLGRAARAVVTAARHGISQRLRQPHQRRQARISYFIIGILQVLTVLSCLRRRRKKKEK